jgi:hypothetical protein
MPTIKIALDAESFRRLADVAIEQRRAIPLQAEILVLQALGRWPVSDHPSPADGPVEGKSVTVTATAGSDHA